MRGGRRTRSTSINFQIMSAKMFEVLVKFCDNAEYVCLGFDAVKDPYYVQHPGIFYDAVADCVEHPDKDGFSLVYVDSEQPCNVFCKALTDEGLEAKVVPI